MADSETHHSKKHHSDGGVILKAIILKNIILIQIVLNLMEEGGSPTKVQLATITLFFGTLFPLFTTIVNARLALTVIRRVLALF